MLPPLVEDAQLNDLLRWEDGRLQVGEDIQPRLFAGHPCAPGTSFASSRRPDCRSLPENAETYDRVVDTIFNTAALKAAGGGGGGMRPASIITGSATHTDIAVEKPRMPGAPLGCE